MKTLRIGMAQMTVIGGNPTVNMERAIEILDEAVQKGCQLVVLPEGFDLGWAHSSASVLAEQIPGPRSEVLASYARRHKIYLAAGLTECKGESLYNTALLISPEGEILIKHRKINILSNVEGHFSVGESLQVVDTPVGRIGLAICADLSPEALMMGHTLGRMGAELVLSPAAWAVPPEHDQTISPYGWDLWRPAYTRLATLYDLGVVGVSNVGMINDGSWQDWRCIGCSMAVAPGGQIVAEGSYGAEAEELIVIDLPVVQRKDRGTETGSMTKKRGWELT